MQRGLAPPQQIHWLNLAPVLSVLTILCLTPPPLRVAGHSHRPSTQRRCPQITCISELQIIPRHHLSLVGLCKCEIFCEGQVLFVVSGLHLQSSLFWRRSGITGDGPSLEGGGATLLTLWKGLPFQVWTHSLTFIYKDVQMYPNRDCFNIFKGLKSPSIKYKETISGWSI